ncbi:TetR/AcrR family transcriptional regulator [Leuconostoc lactis]|uniref:TetR/AcrR family transcriptional regulator n=1 Tax=Leuconostoc lactis TaxID=1246 RepID=UPI0008150769|nr:TetR/AcrR family transcriptional regulator [Leuconostoc lactis]ANY12397.1 hypothetical protein BCR17_08455 [Leuconostoc lactis]
MTRKKEFDVEQALAQATNIFWQQGYEKTSMQDLVDTMNINRASIYSTFGDKQSLFLLALSYYHEEVENQIFDRTQNVQSTQQKIKNIFKVFIDHDDTQPKGCLIVNSATELADLNPQVKGILKTYFASEKKYLLNILENAQDELEESINLNNVAALLQNHLVGIRVLSKTGLSKSELNDLAVNIINTLPWKKEMEITL